MKCNWYLLNWDFFSFCHLISIHVMCVGVLRIEFLKCLTTHTFGVSLFTLFWRKLAFCNLVTPYLFKMWGQAYFFIGLRSPAYPWWRCFLCLVRLLNRGPHCPCCSEVTPSLPSGTPAETHTHSFTWRCWWCIRVTSNIFKALNNKDQVAM